MVRYIIILFLKFNMQLFSIMIIAIHTVFILKENILFIEEWIYYHILLGFNKFYLYDNSKMNKVTGFDSRHRNVIVGGKVNKYGVNYDKIVNITDKEMNDYMKKLCERYKCIEIIEWSPTDREGNILYDQVKAHNHCLEILKRDGIDWCANIDMDEYIVMKDFDDISKYISSLPEEMKNIKLGQILFDSRFNNINRLVTNIMDAESKYFRRDHSNKNIYNVKNTNKLFVHSAIIEGSTYKPSIKDIWFNHYKSRDNNYKYIDNINASIKIKLDNYSFISFT